MLKAYRDSNSLRELLLTLLPTCGTLAGISLALVGLINFRVASGRVAAFADDLVLVSALGFVSCCYMIFFALRHLQAPHLRFWTNLIDGVFLLALTLLLSAGFVVVYVML